MTVFLKPNTLILLNYKNMLFLKAGLPFCFLFIIWMFGDKLVCKYLLNFIQCTIYVSLHTSVLFFYYKQVVTVFLKPNTLILLNYKNMLFLKAGLPFCFLFIIWMFGDKLVCKYLLNFIQCTIYVSLHTSVLFFYYKQVVTVFLKPNTLFLLKNKNMLFLKAGLPFFPFH